MSSPFSFKLQHSHGLARAGVFTTVHGEVKTPIFMPVATQASVKALSPDEVTALGAQIVLSNAYHLYLQPGVQQVHELGGLHQFMGWPKPILTDSGGFQAFSMGSLRKIDDSGIRFRSHLDGSEHRFNPQLATENQQGLGADIIMCLDQCIAHGVSKREVKVAMERTHNWALECYQVFNESAGPESQALFGIVQGGAFPDLREESAQVITGIPFQGYAIGGLAVGESKEQMYEITAQVAEHLPQDKPRYLMGVGSPEDLVEGVARGVDMFDCVIPTRSGRTGLAFTWEGKINLRNSKFKDDDQPLDKNCNIRNLNKYSKSYLNHLIKTNEILASMIISLHNVNFYQEFMEKIRKSIDNGKFNSFYKKYINKYN